MEEQEKKPKGKFWRILHLVLVCIIGIAAAAWILLFHINHFQLEIRLHGDPTVFVEYVRYIILTACLK